MIRIFHYSYGQRHAVLQFTCRTGAHIGLWGVGPLRRPDIGHLRMFGCLTYSHVPSEKRTKLEPTVEKGILVGYSETTKRYRIYLPTQRKLVVRRDVRIEEDRAFRKSVELRDRDSQALEAQQDLFEGQYHG